LIKKKESIINYRKPKEVLRFVAFTKENSSVSAESLKYVVIKDKLNLVMETANTWIGQT
jgi:hypothetical protein